MTKGAQTKQRMLTVTASLMRRQGFHATGLNQVIKDSGAPKGSLYFHFPGGKDELATAALDYAAVEWREKLVQAIGDAPRDFVRSIIVVCEALAADLEASGFTDGCPLATVALEIASENQSIRKLSERHFRDWEAMFAEHLVVGGVEPARAEVLATLVLSSIEGALLLSRTYGNTEPLRRVGRQLARLAAEPSSVTETVVDEQPSERG
jgi:TetR/AcrR family transcriptional repressor of lmrAB and yxaGH operons